MKKLLLLFVLISFQISCAQNEKDNSGLKFYIDKDVTNAKDEPAKEIIKLWKDYLETGKFREENSPFWSYENMNRPDEYLWAIGVPSLKSRDYEVQCKIVGVFPVENGFYTLKSAFSHLDENGEINIDAIVSVYAKKFGDKYLLVNSAEYLKTVLDHYKVGSINYYVHPFHKFDRKQAEEMNVFNQFMVKEFNTEPIEFDYFVANSAREIVEVWGYEYMSKMYIPAQTGGVASITNKIIYAGNNSEYYPHELVHIYTFALVPKDYHFWIGEGIATFYGGSGGNSLDWHLGKLKKFLAENPDYDLSDIDKLGIQIPNGEYQTDFRYVIGGFLMKKIYEKYGVQGFIDALQIGGGSVKEFHKKASNEDFFNFLEEKLDFKKENFDAYIKEEMYKI
ncbi:hypothetical protein [Aureivirga sp. CE67]|uniref:hypothetical protein n=1 Tax=Aureivirga sp. CE67 TaxID=1788983 RepID=UPI0018CB6D9C|nr:hypothetical protein [Aureivirga sp. CE67]